MCNSQRMNTRRRPGTNAHVGVAVVAWVGPRGRSTPRRREPSRAWAGRALTRRLPPVSDPERRGKSLGQLGSWMYQSHESYSACGLGRPQTDALVQQVRNEAGNGIYGARVTDKGSGTVCILYEGEQGWETVQRIREAYERQYGIKTGVFT